MSTPKLIVTGGAGFIGSAVIRHFIRNTDYTIINIDKLTYAGNLQALAEVTANSRYYFEQHDICDTGQMQRIFRQYQPTSIMHLAAESHVDRSIAGPAAFVQTNIVGTYSLLEATRDYWLTLSAEARHRFRFHHVSTDEVYGSLQPPDPPFTETTPYAPNSPYAASKAASDHLVRAWHHTYGLPTVTSNCANNYGPWQYPEKLIPLVIDNALQGKPLPIYGKGDNIRDWLYVDDHARALQRVLEAGRPGETYNIGGHNEKTNVAVVSAICELLDELLPQSPHKPHSALITYVTDRPGHDKRYAIDARRMQEELNWVPQESFESGLRKTVEHYLRVRSE